MNALINIADGFWGRLDGTEQTGSSTYIYHILMIAETHTHTHTLSLPHTCTSLSVSLTLPCRPFKLPMSFSVGCQNTIWLLATLPGVVSHFHPIQAGREGREGVEGVASSIKVCCGRQSISGLCCLHISHCHSAPSKPTRASQPQMGDGASSPSSYSSSHFSCHPPNVINALPLHTDSARDTLS